ncbi:hypothetical protein CLIB1423_01S10726 [[Candida] railenensis]|uniref:Uncharacterized protein n=1 Tax=[Candida] railenensis TaxID=45579 RepID=A0A9P0QKS9_9ASCO|nr:hypothetical protein CLIB1423_01S10726 [[Candida] railenensis]
MQICGIAKHLNTYCMQDSLRGNVTPTVKSRYIHTPNESTWSRFGGRQSYCQRYRNSEGKAKQTKQRNEIKRRDFFLLLPLLCIVMHCYALVFYASVFYASVSLQCYSSSRSHLTLSEFLPVWSCSYHGRDSIYLHFTSPRYCNHSASYTESFVFSHCRIYKTCYSE